MPLRITNGQLILPTDIVMECAILDIPLVRQEESLWCWAACAEMVLRYYDKNEDKCVIANWLLGQETCCINSSSEACNKICKEADVCRIYKHYGINCPDPTRNHIPFEMLRAEICEKRPVQVGFAFDNKAVGHLVLVRGCYIRAGGEQWVIINNPLSFEYKKIRYSTLLSNPYYGKWKVTWTGLRKEA